MTIFYNYNNAKKEITQKQYDDLMNAVELYNACIGGEDFNEPVSTWNIDAGIYFGIISDCHYSRNSNGVLFAIVDVIVDNACILRMKIAASGIFSIWQRAYRKFKNTDSFGDGSELIGEVIKFQAENSVYNNNTKPFTSIKRLYFLPNEEFEALCDSKFDENNEEDNDDE